jgi:hypothetical protein
MLPGNEDRFLKDRLLCSVFILEKYVLNDSCSRIPSITLTYL